MEERLRFVARRIVGESMSDSCREFGISRKTGYKLFNGYKEHGLEALSDRSRRPVRYANQLPGAIERMIAIASARSLTGGPERSASCLCGVWPGIGQKHGAYSAGPSWPGQARRTETRQQGSRYAIVSWICGQRPVVC